MAIGAFLVGVGILNLIPANSTTPPGFPPIEKWPLFQGHFPTRAMRCDADGEMIWFYAFQADWDKTILKLDSDLMAAGYFPRWRKDLDFEKRSLTFGVTGYRFLIQRDLRIGDSSLIPIDKAARGWMRVTRFDLPKGRSGVLLY